MKNKGQMAGLGHRAASVRMLGFVGLSQLLCFGLLPVIAGLSQGEAILEGLNGRFEGSQFGSVWPLVGAFWLVGALPGVGCLVCGVAIKRGSSIAGYFGLLVVMTQLLVLLMISVVLVMSGLVASKATVTCFVLFMGSPMVLLGGTVKSLWMLVREKRDV